MSEASKDAFYVGYLKQAPEALAPVIRRRILCILAVCAAVAAAITTVQERYVASVYEFGRVRTLQGILYETPYPSLWVTRSTDDDIVPLSRMLLVENVKRGSEARVAGLHGRAVEVEGTRIHHDGRTMIELTRTPIVALDTEGKTAPDRPGEDLGESTLVGEIVDSKCYFGLMNPGNLKTHKSCAIRCISGGIPPSFLVRDTDGGATTMLLVDAEGGRVNDRVLGLVAEPLEIRGRVMRFDNVLVLFADPAHYRRL